jgi:acyl carrier protein
LNRLRAAIVCEQEGQGMDRDQVSERLKDVLVTELGLDADKINDDANFEEDLEVDSLGVVELLMALEDEFGVKIPDEEAEDIRTVGQAVDMVHGKL